MRKSFLRSKYLCILPEVQWQRLGARAVNKEEAIIKLLDEWETAARAVVHETSSDWDRDLAKIQERKEEYQKLLGL